MNITKKRGIGLVCVIALAVACAILLLSYRSPVTVRVLYENKMPAKNSRLYFDTGSGIEKKNSVKRTLKTKNQKFTIQKQKVDIQDVKLVPVTGSWQGHLVLMELAVYSKDGLVYQANGEKLQEVFTQSEEVVQQLDGDKLFLFIDGENVTLSFSPKLVQAIRMAQRGNWSLRLYCLFIWIGVVFLAIYWKNLKRILLDARYHVKAIISYGVITLGVLVTLIYQYRKEPGFASQILLWLGVVAVAQIVHKACNRRSASNNYLEKLLSLLLLGQTICGAGWFGKQYESLTSDLMFYGIITILQLALFCAFWIFEKKSLGYIFYVCSIWLFRLSICYFGYGWTMKQSLAKTFNYLGAEPGMLSFLGVFGLVGLCWGILGYGWASVVYVLAYIFTFSLNMVEMVYHSTFLKAVDILSFGDFQAILSHYISGWVGVGVFAVFLALLFVLYRFRHPILAYLVPKRNSVVTVFSLLLVMWSLSALDGNVFKDCFEIRNDNTWSLETSMEKRQGFYGFSYINLKRYLALVPNKPEDYAVSRIAEEMQAYQTAGAAPQIEWSEKPDVIFLMLESIIDPKLFEKYGVVYSEPPALTMQKYKLATTMASSFGGFTAKSEFEALTGLSDVFTPFGAVQYSAYFTNQSEKTYSVVDVFERAGYQTSAFHQNDKTFYNRSAAYQSFDFDKFVAKGSFEETREDYNADNYLKNTHFLKLIKQQLEETTQPQFIWGVTIESHAPYDKKYNQMDIDVSAKDLDEKQEWELNQYIQSVKNTDKMLEELIAYLEQRNRPAILVAFGDHLPRLSAWDVWKTAENVNDYYGTMCVAYATEGELSLPYERISINYLAPFVVRQAGITDEPFYNYLDVLETETPIVRNWTMNQLDDEKKHMYEMLQYDILFEKGYFKPTR